MRINVTQIMEVRFSDKQKAYDYFIEGDWKNYFYEEPDLEQLFAVFAPQFISVYNNVNDYWDMDKRVINIEGFPSFKFHGREAGYYAYSTEVVPDIGVISLLFFAPETEVE